MILEDLHVHTTYCDGIDPPEEVVRAAIDLHLERIGFSGHSYVSFDESYCMSKESITAYKSEITRLKEKYKNKITVLCGIEQDIYSEMPVEDYDYVIGSVHYLKKNDIYLPLDETAEILSYGVDTLFHRDFYQMAENYYQLVSEMAQRQVDIIGHFDLITKFNKDNRLFSENDSRYTAAARIAIDRLIAAGKVFEINTGGISRGYKIDPYPSISLLQYIIQKEGKLIFSSDAHSAQNLCFEFEKWRQVVGELGYSESLNENYI